MGCATGDFSGLVNTPSGWLPQSVVNQFKGIAPANAVTAGDSVIYQQYNVVNGNQFTPVTLPPGTRHLRAVPGQHDSDEHAGRVGAEDRCR